MKKLLLILLFPLIAQAQTRVIPYVLSDTVASATASQVYYIKDSLVVLGTIGGTDITASGTVTGRSLFLSSSTTDSLYLDTGSAWRKKGSTEMDFEKVVSNTNLPNGIVSLMATSTGVTANAFGPRLTFTYSGSSISATDLGYIDVIRRAQYNTASMLIKLNATGTTNTVARFDSTYGLTLGGTQGTGAYDFYAKNGTFTGDLSTVDITASGTVSADSVAVTNGATIGGAVNLLPTATSSYTLSADSLAGYFHVLNIQNQTPGQYSFVDLFSADGDTTDIVGYRIFARGTPDNQTDVEYLTIQFSAVPRVWDFSSSVEGMGKRRPMYFTTTSDGGPTMIIDTSGNLVVRNGIITSGISDSIAGTIRAFGQVAGSTQGGRVLLYTAEDHDGTYDYYDIEATSATLTIHNSANQGLALSGAGNASLTGSLSAVGTVASDSSFTINERSDTPSIPTSNTQVKQYVKGDKLIWWFNAGGTAHYFYIDLTATADQQVIYSATEP